MFVDDSYSSRKCSIASYYDYSRIFEANDSDLSFHTLSIKRKRRYMNDERRKLIKQTVLKGDIANFQWRQVDKAALILQNNCINKDSQQTIGGFQYYIGWRCTDRIRISFPRAVRGVSAGAVSPPLQRHVAVNDLAAPPPLQPTSLYFPTFRVPPAISLLIIHLCIDYL